MMPTAYRRLLFLLLAMASATAVVLSSAVGSVNLGLDGWWAANGSKTYFAVTREAAREKTRRLRDIAAGYEQLLRARGQQLVRAHALTVPAAWTAWPRSGRAGRRTLAP